MVESKVAFVTGAASGIRRATAAVVLVDLDIDGGISLDEVLHCEGHTSAYVACDMRDCEHLKDCVDRVVAQYGDLDSAANNSGVEEKLAK